MLEPVITVGAMFRILNAVVKNGQRRRLLKATSSKNWRHDTRHNDIHHKCH
jgi:hypothetical protein